MKILALFPLLFLAAPLGYGATWIPIQPSNPGVFFDTDIIYENSRSSPGTGTVPSASAFGSRYFYETGLDGTANGLNSTGSYTYGGASAANGAAFQLQSYTANNVNLSNTGETATATFAGGNYDTIAIAASVGGGTNGDITSWTVTYTSGPPLIVTSLAIQDWNFGGTSGPNDLFNVGRTNTVNISTAAAADETGIIWSAFVYTLDTDPTRAIQSISYTVDSGAGTVAVFGFSGQTIPEPSSSALLGAAFAGSLLIRRKK